MRLKVLLVDDEYIVLKGLEIMLSEQKEVPLEIVTAMDAVDAMEKLSGRQPDVIVADICMPEVDGLTMLEKISDIHPQCSFIIVSGYEEHEYLKRALRLHVADYLTKPVDKAYLIHRLSELAGQKQARIRHTLLKIRLMLFSGEALNLNPEDLTELFPHPCFTLCAAGLTASEAEERKEAIAAYFDCFQIFSQNNWSVFLLNHPARIRQKEIRSLLDTLLSGTDWGISSFPSGKNGMADISRADLSFQEALCDMVLSLLPADSLLKEETAFRIAGRTLKPAIRVLMFEYGISDYIGDAYDEALDLDSNFLLVFTETLAAYILTAGIHLPSDTILQLYRTQSKSVNDKKALSTFLERTLNFWYDSFTPSEQASYSSKISLACQYMEQHYTEDIALEQVAEYVSINPSYLSYIFKKETGITFLQYLTDLRMRKACELMTEEPALSLEEIAVRIGYHSASYFHKIFRARFGVTPRQWLLEEHDRPSQNERRI